MNTQQKFFFTTALLALACMGCRPQAEGNKPAADAKPMMMKADLSTVTLKLSNPTVTVKLPGEIVSDRESPIHAKVSAFVKTLEADIGSVVTNGQIVATLEAPELTAKVASLDAQVKAQRALVTYAENHYKRYLDAAKKPGVVSALDVEKANSDLLNEQAKLVSIEASLEESRAMTDYLVLTAPFDGVVTERAADIGSLVAPGTAPVMRLQDQRNLRLRVKVAERHTPFVRAGTPLSFVARSRPDHPATLPVTRQAGTLDATLRSETVEADIANTDGAWMPGMVVDVTLPLQAETPSFFVPKSSVVDGNLGVYVMAVRGGKTKRVNVRKGRVLGMTQEIFGDLNEGERILKILTEEMKVETPVP